MCSAAFKLRLQYMAQIDYKLFVRNKTLFNAIMHVIM